MLHGNERAALFRCLHHNHAPAEAADDPVPSGEGPPGPRRSRRVLGKDAALSAGIRKQLPVGFGIYFINAAAQNADHGCSCRQRTVHCGAVYTHCHAGNHDPATGGNAVAHPPCSRAAVSGRMPGSHNADHGILIHVRQGSQNIQDHGRVEDAFQPGWVAAVLQTKDTHILLHALAQDFLFFGQIFIQQRLDRIGTQPGKLLKFSRTGFVHLCRGGKMLYKPHPQIIAQPGSPGQPDPVLQHAFSSFRRFTGSPSFPSAT